MKSWHFFAVSSLNCRHSTTYLYLFHIDNCCQMNSKAQMALFAIRFFIFPSEYILLFLRNKKSFLCIKKVSRSSRTNKSNFELVFHGWLCTCIMCSKYILSKEIKFGMTFWLFIKHLLCAFTNDIDCKMVMVLWVKDCNQSI